MIRPILLIGGAPEVALDAVRYMSVRASGQTAARLKQYISQQGAPSDCITLLLSEQALPDLDCERYRTRQDLEGKIKGYLTQNPQALMLMSAAINDYELAVTGVRLADQSIHELASHEKAPSGAEELVIRLKPAAKLIDQLGSYGHQGPLIACKYEDAATVVISAQRLRERVQADCVVANSLCGQVQALVNADAVEHFSDREQLLQALGRRIYELSVI